MAKIMPLLEGPATYPRESSMWVRMQYRDVSLGTLAVGSRLPRGPHAQMHASARSTLTVCKVRALWR